MNAFPQIPVRSKAAIVVLALLCASLACYATDTASPHDLDRGYQQMYNLDFPGAHATFRAYQQAHPEDPMGHVSNAAAYLFSEFNRLHILESDLFIDDHNFDNRSKLTPDPAVKTNSRRSWHMAQISPTRVWRETARQGRAVLAGDDQRTARRLRRHD